MIHSTGSQGKGVAMEVPVIVLLVLLFIAVMDICSTTSVVGKVSHAQS